MLGKRRKQGGTRLFMVIIDSLHEYSVRKLVGVAANVVQKYSRNQSIRRIGLFRQLGALQHMLGRCDLFSQIGI